ncbi:MAG TPA: TolC family protein [Gemmatimonadaceae bacterium]|jgi:outer membrane protein|nr:TolC family protein [Gemmatimonadaceae bacterium]
MSIHRTMLAVALTFGAAATVAAQRFATPKPGQPITFADAIGIALEQNVAVRQAANVAALGQATVQQQKIQLLPDLRLSVSGSDNVGRSFSQTEGSIINQQTQSLSSGLSTSLTLFDGGKTRASIRSAESSQDASEQDLARAKQTAVFSVASDYVALSNAQEQLQVQQENLAAQQAQLALIQKFVSAGARPVSDQYQQAATVASARLAVVQAARAVELAKVDLIGVLRLDPASAYDFAAPALKVNEASPSYSLDSLIARAYATRVDLEAEQTRATAAAQDVKIAKASRLPTISVTGSYSSAFNSASELSMADQLDQRRGGSIGVGISIPLFDRGAASVAEQRAQIAEENARLALDNQKQTIALEVRRAYLDQASAREQLAAAEAQRAAATQSVTMTEQRYQAGAATLVEVTQARAQQVQAASAVATARNNLVLQETVMAYYTGALDPGTAKLGA